MGELEELLPPIRVMVLPLGMVSVLPLPVVFMLAKYPCPPARTGEVKLVSKKLPFPSPPTPSSVIVGAAAADANIELLAADCCCAVRLVRDDDVWAAAPVSAPLGVVDPCRSLCDVREVVSTEPPGQTPSADSPGATCSPPSAGVGADGGGSDSNKLCLCK